MKKTKSDKRRKHSEVQYGVIQQQGFALISNCATTILNYTSKLNRREGFKIVKVMITEL
jgi:hypothetical protein